MQLYLAPMEEITGYIFRNVTDRHFSGADKFITPFVVPNQRNILKTKDGREINPEHNAGKKVVIQVLTNSSDYFTELAEYIYGLGYDEINLNFGCPSNTVAKKFRGSGMLIDLKKMDEFLNNVFASGIFSKEGIGERKISIKTRIGFDSEEYWDEIVDIFNKYPISELIVHPRIKTDMYGNVPRMEAFRYAVEHYNGNLGYNGDIYSAQKYNELKEEFQGSNVTSMMIGRGAVANPGIFREICTGQRATSAEIREWHDELFDEYAKTFSPKDAMFKLKEVWFYLGNSFEEIEKPLKAIRKSNTENDYRAAAKEIWKKDFCPQ